MDAGTISIVLIVLNRFSGIVNYAISLSTEIASIALVKILAYLSSSTWLKSKVSFLVV